MAEYVKNTFLYKISWIRNLVDKILQEKFLEEGNDSNVDHLKKPIPGIRQQDGKTYPIKIPPIDLDNREGSGVKKRSIKKDINTNVNFMLSIGIFLYNINNPIIRKIFI